MNIKIKEITLKNFKGVKRLNIDFNGGNLSIFGDNGTGKTTVQDGFTWCLFGKDSANSATFDIKPIQENGEATHNLDCSVELILSAGDIDLILKRVYAEKYTRRRGQASAEFTGHTTSYFVNDVPVNEKEYKAKISGIIQEDTFRLLTNPKYFNGLHWQEKRKLLLEICGDIPDEDVIKSDHRLTTLPEVLAGRTLDDYRKIVTAQKTKINGELKNIPVRIDEAKKSRVEITATETATASEAANLQEKKRKKEQELSDIVNGGDISKKRVELQEVVAKIQKADNDFEKDRTVRIKDKSIELDKLNQTKETLEKTLREYANDISSYTLTILGSRLNIKQLKDEWFATRDNIFKSDGVCPTCGQELPEDQIEAAKAAFNKNKSDNLEAINTEGKQAKADIELIQKNITEIEKKQKAENGKLEAVKKDIADVQKDIADIQAEGLIQAELGMKKTELEKAIVDTETKTDTEPLKATIRDLETQIQAQQLILSQIEANKKTEFRITELTGQEKKRASEFEQIEGNLFLIECFIKAKVRLLEEKINGKFRQASFKLFSDQINGGLNECCITTLNGVPYDSVNSAGKIQAGLDQIKTFQDHYGYRAPIFIDNAESVVKLPEMDCQIIRLVVSEKDKTLRFEEK